ncbi:MAG: DNA cytosine methyltransferase, partial [Streptomyces sp.]|nr:DNA cytosine methyltransferase [Streptomyces sp.]
MHCRTRRHDRVVGVQEPRPRPRPAAARRTPAPARVRRCGRPGVLGPGVRRVLHRRRRRDPRQGLLLACAADGDLRGLLRAGCPRGLSGGCRLGGLRGACQGWGGCRVTRAIHLFAGPGGLELGAEAVGVSGVGIEWDANAVATRVAAGLATVHGDVRRYGPADFPDATVLTAGPPCQTYTVAGSGAGRQAMADVLGAVKAMGARTAVDSGLLGDERTGLVLEPLRWILAALDSGRPYTAVVLEQVQQVQQVQQVWNAYAEVLRVEGYSVATGVLRTEQFGVPQTRRRAVLVARLDGPVALPEPSRR